MYICVYPFSLGYMYKLTSIGLYELAHTLMIRKYAHDSAKDRQVTSVYFVIIVFFYGM